LERYCVAASKLARPRNQPQSKNWSCLCSQIIKVSLYGA
jgi:hypothetical protein